MLPEHVEKLKEMWAETEKIKKPLIDAQEWEQMNDQLFQALQYNLPIRLDFYQDGKIETFTGEVLEVDTQQGMIKLQLAKDIVKIFPCQDIITLEEI